MRLILSFSVSDPELFAKIEEFKQRGGNLSRLINNLLKQYFNGDLDLKTISKEIVEVRQLKRRYEELRSELDKLLEKLNELEKELEEKAEEKELEESLPLIRKLREVVFDDIESLLQKAEAGKIDLKHAITTRLSAFASENNISLPKAKELFFKAFPDLKDKLEGLL